MCELSAEFQPGLDVAVEGRVLPLFAKEPVYEVFMVGVCASSVECEVFDFAFPVSVLAFHGVPPASVPEVACFSGGVSAMSVGVTKCAVEVTEVSVE